MYLFMLSCDLFYGIVSIKNVKMKRNCIKNSKIVSLSVIEVNLL